MAIITDEMKKAAIGIESKPVVIEIEKGMIRKFAEAIGDANPLWQDEPYAKKSRFQGIIAPPGMVHAAMLLGVRPQLPFEIPVKRRLDGGGDWEYFLPINAGEKLTVVNRISDIKEREGKESSMVFVTYETDWKNEKGQLVARAHFVLILR